MLLYGLAELHIVFHSEYDFDKSVVGVSGIVNLVPPERESGNACYGKTLRSYNYLRNRNEMERKRIFVDGMESVSLTDGMIRMELYNVLLNRSRNPDSPSEHEVTGELIMTPQGFIKAFSTMETLVRKLENAGIIKRSAESEGESGELSKLSPNF